MNPARASQAANGLVIAAPSSSSGKTTLTLALLRAFRRRGVDVVSAKAGPDYIDPRFHAAASGAECVNLDPWAMRRRLLPALYAELAAGRDLAIVEGMMGLFDGAADGQGSTGDLAAILGLPVILVVDAAAQSQSVAAIIEGFARHRRDVEIVGMVLNRVGSARHELMLRAALDDAGIPVLGVVHSEVALALPSRHLGLVQAGEHADLEAFLDTAAEIVEGALDLDAVAALARPATPLKGTVPASLPPLGQRIALAADKAFAFAYSHLTAGWRAAGAEIVEFSPLADTAPDAAADAVFLPGGYPELHAGTLAANAAFLDGLRACAGRGVPVYGECGGYMVLGEALIDADGARHAMAGLLPVTTSFARRELHLGYRKIKPVAGTPWPYSLRGHEFHYARLVEEGPGEPLFEVRDALDEELGTAGRRAGSACGSFMHVIDMLAD